MSYTAVIILQYNNWQETLSCLASFQRHNTSPVKYIFIDNGSPAPDALPELTRGLRDTFGDSLVVVDDSYRHPAGTPLPQATLLASSTNDGYARGNNKGLSLVWDAPEVDHILILNNDTLMVEDIVEPLLRDIDSKSDAAFVTPLLLASDGGPVDMTCARRRVRYRDCFLLNMLMFRELPPLRRSIVDSLPATPGLYRAPVISGSCMMCRKDLFKRLGGFDPGTFLYYEEDILTARADRFNLHNYIDTRLRCIHLGAASTSRVSSMFVVKTNFASQSYYFKQYRHMDPASMFMLRASHAWVVALKHVAKLWRKSK